MGERQTEKEGKGMRIKVLKKKKVRALKNKG